MSGEAATKKKAAAYDEAIDSLHTLPLEIMPVLTPGLKKALMIKNAPLNSVVELFKDSSTGSGQVTPEELPGFIHGHDETLQQDIQMLERLARLESFDVYSLRMQLRESGIGFENYDALQLSPTKRAELTEYMKTFTRPLIQRIYGGEQTEITDVSQIITMVAQPNRERAISELKKLASELGVELIEVPAFLERYGDVFLSLSYFRSCLDAIMEDIPLLLEWMNQARENQQVRSDRNSARVMDEVEESFNQISTSIVGRFEVFDQRSHAFWSDINANSFRVFQDLVKSHHVSIGAVLCGLAVKTGIWKDRFPTREGGPLKRVEFVRSEIFPGLARILKIEQEVGSVM
jgi:hypothetical protein